MAGILGSLAALAPEEDEGSGTWSSQPQRRCSATTRPAAERPDARQLQVDWSRTSRARLAQGRTAGRMVISAASPSPQMTTEPAVAPEARTNPPLHDHSTCGCPGHSLGAPGYRAAGPMTSSSHAPSRCEAACRASTQDRAAPCPASSDTTFANLTGTPNPVAAVATA